MLPHVIFEACQTVIVSARLAHKWLVFVLRSSLCGNKLVLETKLNQGHHVDTASSVFTHCLSSRGDHHELNRQDSRVNFN